MRNQVKEEQVKELLDRFEKKLRYRLSQKGHGAFYSYHEALGVITEEQYELTQAVQSNDPKQIEEEMIDVAVAAIWGLAK